MGGDGGKFTPEISQTPCTESSLRNELEKGGAPESWEAGTWRHSERPLGSWVGMGVLENGATEGAPWELGDWDLRTQGGAPSELGHGVRTPQTDLSLSLQFQLPSPPNAEEAGIFQLPFPLGSIALIQAALGRSNGWAGTVPERVGGRSLPACRVWRQD